MAYSNSAKRGRFRLKSAEKPRPTALARILAARRFACPTNWRASCLNSESCQPEVVSDVKSGMGVYPTGVNVLFVKFCDSRPNRSRDIDCLTLLRMTTITMTTATTTPADGDTMVLGRFCLKISVKNFTVS